MADVVVVCVDGSELADRAAEVGMGLLRPPGTVVVATVVEPVDVTLGYDASGFAGAVLTEEQVQEEREASLAAGREVVGAVAERLSGPTVETRVLEGHPGEAVCDLAAELQASALVIGSRGRGGLRRAILGSVSDHVVRHAPCPVVVVRDADG